MKFFWMSKYKFAIIGEGKINTMPNAVYKSLKKLDLNVSLIATDNGHLHSRNWLINRFYLEINKVIDFFKSDRDYISIISKISPDFIIIFKGDKVNIHILKEKFKNIKFINWHVDDPFNENYIDIIGIDSLLKYDMHLSSREHLFPEYEKLGLKNVNYIEFAADSEIFNIYSSNKYFITFVGNYSQHRDRIIRKISENFKISVWGSGWYKNYKNKNKNLTLNGFSHYKNYIKVSKSSCYSLNILTPENSDKSNLRIFEQIAIGANQLVLGDLNNKIETQYSINSFKAVDELVNYISNDINVYKFQNEIFYENRVGKLLNHIDEIWSNSTL
jgi:hypothetical protein